MLDIFLSCCDTGHIHPIKQENCVDDNVAVWCCVIFIGSKHTQLLSETLMVKSTMREIH